MVAFLMVAVPEVAPMMRAVAALPSVRVVAFASKMDAFDAVVERTPPLRAALPLVVMLPDVPLIEKLVAWIFPVPKDNALVILEPEISMAVVIPPPAEEIRKAVGNARS